MAGRDSDLETFKAMFKDEREFLTVGKIVETDMAKDRSVYRVKVELLEDGRFIVCRAGAIASAPDAGIYALVQVGDLVLIAMPDGDEDYGTVIKSFSSREDKIPEEADTGTVIAAQLGKMLHLLSQERINIGKSGDTTLEPLVLGLVMKAALTDLYGAFLDAAQIGISPTGPVTLDPGIRAKLTADKAKYVTAVSTNIVSQLTFTERGA